MRLAWGAFHRASNTRIFSRCKILWVRYKFFKGNRRFRALAGETAPHYPPGNTLETSPQGGSGLPFLSRYLLPLDSALAGSLRRSGEGARRARHRRSACRELRDLAGRRRPPDLGRERPRRSLASLLRSGSRAAHNKRLSGNLGGAPEPDAPRSRQGHRRGLPRCPAPPRQRVFPPPPPSLAALPS